LDENKQIHQHDTRKKENFYAYVVKSEIWKRAIKYKDGRLWNNLPTNIKTIKSLFLFKQKLKNPFITVFGKTGVIVLTFLLSCYLVFVSVIRKLHFVYVYVCTYEGLRICIPGIKIEHYPCLTCTVAHAPSFVSFFCQYSFYITYHLS